MSISDPESREHGFELGRRDFLAGAMAGALSAGIPTGAVAEEKSGATAPTSRATQTWGYLVHLSFNMWRDRPLKAGKRANDDAELATYDPTLRFDDELWKQLKDEFERCGINQVVIDVGDGIALSSHPEIAVKNAWTVDRAREEIADLTRRGIEVIPKMNFSTCHDLWMGKMSRMVSSPEYYRFCQEVIAEVAAIFGKPRFFHIGYDEETCEAQQEYSMVIVRQFELWWHDLQFTFDCVRKAGCRPWMWSDHFWGKADEMDKLPRDVLQSNWYYGTDFNHKIKPVVAYDQLAEHGLEQVPTFSNWANSDNAALTVQYIRAARLPNVSGFMTAPWFPTLLPYRQRLFAAARQIGELNGALVKK